MRTCTRSPRITDGNDGLVNVDLAECASLPQPGLQFRGDPRVLAVGFPVLVKQLDCRPKCGHILINHLADPYLFYEEPAAGLDELGDALEDALGVRELCVSVCMSFFLTQM